MGVQSINFASFRTHSSLTLFDDLVAYWNLDEASGNAVDAHGSHDLTDTNTVTSDATGGPSGGQCRVFTAANSEYFTKAHHADLSFSGSFTIAAWVRMASTNADRGLLGKYLSAGNKREYLLRFFNSGDRFALTVSEDGGFTNINTVQWGAAASADTWYFVVAWYDNVAQTINISVNNGTPVSAAHTDGVFSSDGQFDIGAQGGAATHDGKMARVGLWNRRLTPSEKTFLYNSGSGRNYADLV